MRAAKVWLAGLTLVLGGCTSASPIALSGSTPSGSAAGTQSSVANPAPSPQVSSQASATGTTTHDVDTSTPAENAGHRVKVDAVLATGLTTPWGVAPLPDGSALLTERDSARLLRLGTNGKLTELGTVDGVTAAGEGGLLGIVAPTPDRAYVYFTAATDNRVVALTLAKDRISSQQPIITGIPKANVHNGGRLAIGPDGLLYIGTGDGGSTSHAQDLGSLGGKILRTTLAGKPAPGNPFPQAPLVYSYGHRNVQGLAFDPQGRLWASEFGQNTWDELNLIKPGGNYGWPTAEGKSDNPEFVSPQQVWSTDQASPSGLAYQDGSLWMAGLRGQRLWEIPIQDGRAGTPIPHLEEQFGRLRTVVALPDGSLWLTTSNTDGRGTPQDGDDRLLRLVISR